MATTTVTNSSQPSPSPFPASLLAGFPPRNFQTANNTSASPSSTPISSTSTTSSNTNGSGVFPNGTPNQQQMATGLFSPNYYAALMQSQVMQQFMKQYMVGLGGADINGGAESRSPSTTTASPSLGQPQQHKKLFLDPDGNILCPICDQKIGPDSWTEHLKLERANLSKSIESLKENKRPNTLFNNDEGNLQSMPEARRKREFELNRIRSNQQKRLSMKGTLMSSSVLRDTSLLMSQSSANRTSQSGKFLIGSLCETPPPRSASGMSGRNGEIDVVDRNFCKSCKRTHEFLIITNGLDQPRCMDCYRKYRRQVGALPLTITESPTDEPTVQPNGHRHGSHTASSSSPVQRDVSGTPHDEDDMFGHQNGDELDEETPLKRPRMDFSLTNE